MKDNSIKLCIELATESGNPIIKQTGKNATLELEKLKNDAFISLIDFAKWYSGMEQEKVVKAYNRYVLEVLNK